MKINLIIRNQDNLVKSVETIDYDKKKFIDCDSFFYYFNGYYKSEIDRVSRCRLGYSVDFDNETKIEFLSCLAKKKKKLDLSIDLYDIKFEDYFKVTNNKPLTLNLKACEICIGGPSDFFELFELLSSIWKFVKFVFFFVVFFLVYFFPFFFIRKTHYYGKNFIISIITRKDNWNYGFLKSDKIMATISNENLSEYCDLEGYKHDFLATNGFDVEGVDYEAEITKMNLAQEEA